MLPIEILILIYQEYNTSLEAVEKEPGQDIKEILAKYL